MPSREPRVNQGFGNVAALPAARREAGAKVIAGVGWKAVCEREGPGRTGAAAHAALEAVSEWKGGRRSRTRSCGDPVRLGLIPAALGGVITKEANGATIDCKVRGGGANEPTTPTADLILEERGIAVIPDFLANGGG